MGTDPIYILSEANCFHLFIYHVWCINWLFDAELDALEADMGMEDEAGVPSYLQPDKEPDLDAELNLPTAPSGHASAQHDRPQVMCVIHDIIF